MKSPEAGGFVFLHRNKDAPFLAGSLIKAGYPITEKIKRLKHGKEESPGSVAGSPGRKARPGRGELKTGDFFLYEGFQECPITYLPVAILSFPGLCRVFLPFQLFTGIFRAII
jgi:hypothetical protein